MAATVAGLALATLAACSEPEPSRAPAEAPPNISARIQVLNADTLVIDDAHLRLAGVYAPQGIPDARCWAEAMASKQAAERLRRIVASAEWIETA